MGDFVFKYKEESEDGYQAAERHCRRETKTGQSKQKICSFSSLTISVFQFEAEDIKSALEDMDEIPSEDTIERAEEVLDTYQSDLKNLFLIIFQRFTMLLSEHIQKCEAQGKTFKNYWFRWIMGRLQQVLFEVIYHASSCVISVLTLYVNYSSTFQFHVHTFNYVPTLKSLVFTNELDQHVLLIFKQFCSLRA